MDISAMSAIFSNDKTALHWGGANGLWDICRNKVIGIPILEMLLERTHDPELKMLIKNGIEMVALPNIEKIQNFLSREGQPYPQLPQRGKLNDEQIARAIREILKLSIDLDVRGFMGVTKVDARNLVWEIILDDRRAFEEIIDLKRRNGWLLNPPNV